MHHNKINKRVVLSMTENNLDAMLFLLDAGESCLLLQDKTRQRSVSNLRKKVEMAVAQIKIKPRVRSPILNYSTTQHYYPGEEFTPNVEVHRRGPGDK